MLAELPGLLQEIRALRYLHAHGPASMGVVKLLGSFTHGGHLCLVLERLSGSLLEYLSHSSSLAPAVQLTHLRHTAFNLLVRLRQAPHSLYCKFSPPLHAAQQGGISVAAAMLVPCCQQTLQQYVGRCPLVGLQPHLQDKVTIFMRMQGSMAVAHAHGVVRAKLKPDNILLRESVEEGAQSADKLSSGIFAAPLSL